MRGTINICILGMGKHYKKNIKPILEKSKKFNIKKEINTNKNEYKKKNINLKNILNDEIEIVYISTPTHTHHKFILASLECNKHVICEKPFVSINSNFKKIIDMSIKKNLFIFECFMYRFHPLFKSLENILLNENLGKISYAISYFNIPSIYPNHRYSQTLGQGFFFDTAVYPLSLFNYLFKINSERVKIKINTIVKNKKNDLRGNVVLSSANFNFFAFWGESLEYKNSLEIIFTKGSIFIEKIFTKSNDEEVKIILNKENNKTKTIIIKNKNHFDEMFNYISNNILTNNVLRDNN